jgi:biotin carboxyl carrier protein
MKFEVWLHSASEKNSRIVDLEQDSQGWRVTLDGKHVAADAVAIGPNIISLLLDGRSYEIRITPSLNGSVKLLIGSQEFIAGVTDPRAWRGRRHGSFEAEGRQQVAAAMPGKVIRLLVQPGDKVEAGQGLLVVEAMKMQNEIRSPKSGVVERLLAKEGQSVNAGEILAWVE